jgi:hypothetical protein
MREIKMKIRCAVLTLLTLLLPTVSPAAEQNSTFRYGLNTTPVTVSNSASETDLQSFTMSGNAELYRAGSQLRIVSRGYVQNTSGSGKTFRFRTYAGSTLLCDSTDQSTAVANAPNPSNASWVFYCDVIVVTPGASGTVEAQGEGLVYKSPLAVQGNSATISLDLTATQTIKTTCTMSAASASTSCVARMMYGERLE